MPMKVQIYLADEEFAKVNLVVEKYIYVFT